MFRVGTGPPPNARPGVFAVGVLDERPPDRGRKKNKKEKEQEKQVVTLREQGKVKLIKTQELLTNLPELAKAGSYMLVRCCCQTACALAPCPQSWTDLLAQRSLP